MLSQSKHLSKIADGRYATDAELQYLVDYVNSYQHRLQLYKKLQSLEPTLINEARARIELFNPKLLQRGEQDFISKWKQDSIRVMRYSATALLLDDIEIHQERFLYWFQTIMRAFGAQQTCDVTYRLMQDVVKKHLTPMELDLLCPILELNRSALGNLS